MEGRTTSRIGHFHTTSFKKLETISVLKYLIRSKQFIFSSACQYTTMLKKYQFIGPRKLKGLQERLRQTEMAMEKILEQLNTISVENINVAKQNPSNSEEGKSSHSHQDVETEQYLRDLEKVHFLQFVLFT